MSRNQRSGNLLNDSMSLFLHVLDTLLASGGHLGCDSAQGVSGIRTCLSVDNCQHNCEQQHHCAYIMYSRYIMLWVNCIQVVYICSWMSSGQQVLGLQSKDKMPIFTLLLGSVLQFLQGQDDSQTSSTPEIPKLQILCTFLVSCKVFASTVVILSIDSIKKKFHW